MSTPALRLIVVLLIYAAFVSMGLPDGLLGAAWPQLRAELGAELNDNWLMLVLGTCGASVSSFASGYVLRRFGIGTVLIVTTLLTGCVIWTFAASTTFALITLLAFFLGLSNGAIDAGLNHFVARNLSSRHMNWLHASWGVGVSLGTLIVSGVFATGGTWRAAYLVVGSLQLSLALAFVSHRRLLPGVEAFPDAAREAAAPSFRGTLAKRQAWTNMSAFFVYCGLESSAGLWIASVLHDGRGWSLEGASLVTTLYWSSLTVGRFSFGIVSRHMETARMLRLAATGAVVGTSLIVLSSLSAARAPMGGMFTAGGVLLTGLSLSPVYPMLMHDTPRVVGAGHAINLIGFQGGAGQLGFALVPIGVGALLQLHSMEWLGALLAALAVALLVLVVARERSGVAS